MKILVDKNPDVVYKVYMSNAEKKQLANRIHQYRLTNCLSQVLAAHALGISISSFVKVESGKGCSELLRAKIERALTIQALQQDNQSQATA